VAHIISGIDLWQALDSRGNPTICAQVTIRDPGAPNLLGIAHATSPAGASAGSHEAVFLRDNGSAYGGASVIQLINRVAPQLSAALIGRSADSPREVHDALAAIDETDNWSGIGGNTATAISIAAWLASAKLQEREPWMLIADYTGTKTPALPLPMVNIISGGAHAARAIDIQDVLAIPLRAHTFAGAIESVWNIRNATREILAARGHTTNLVADEGGLAAPFATNESAVQAVQEAIQSLGQIPGQDSGIGLDIAASEFFHQGNYSFDGNHISASELAQILEKWCHDYGIVSIEDPLSEDDDWSSLHTLVRQIQLVGDDRYVTTESRLHEGITLGEANAVLIKPNQSGTLHGALSTLQAAKKAGWATVVSARSGETEDSWLVDLAVGAAAGQLKVGSTMRSERTAKWNRALEIEHTSRLPYSGSDAINNPRKM
jgi:enolase